MCYVKMCFDVRNAAPSFLHIHYPPVSSQLLRYTSLVRVCVAPSCFPGRSPHSLAYRQICTRAHRRAPAGSLCTYFLYIRHAGKTDHRSPQILCSLLHFLTAHASSNALAGRLSAPASLPAVPGYSPAVRRRLLCLPCGPSRWQLLILPFPSENAHNPRNERDSCFFVCRTPCTELCAGYH